MIVILCLEIFLWLVGEMDDIGRGQYGLIEAVYFVLLQVPYQIYQFFPLACLLGGIIGLGLLAGYSEIIVMRSSGISIYQIVWVVLKLGLVLGLIMMLIGESLAPLAVHFAENRKIKLTSDGQALRTLKGLWIRDQNDYLYIKHFDGNKKVYGVVRYRFNDQKEMDFAASAAEGIIADNYWYMKKVKYSRIGNDQIQSEDLEEQKWALDIPGSVLTLAKITPEELSLKVLFEYIQEQEENETESGIYGLIFWQRLLQPFNTMIMMLLALPFVLGPLKTATLGLKIIAGISLGFVFHILNKLLGPISVVYQFPPFIAAIIPSLLFLALGIFLLRRVI